MAQMKALGVKQIARVARQRGSRLVNTSSGSIKRVSLERMSGGCKMDSDLMRPPGFDLDLQKRSVLSALEHGDQAQSASALWVRSIYSSELRMRHRCDRGID
jgi:hypothetical protein